MTKRYLIDTCEQCTPEWHQLRAGRVTGSKADCVDAKARDGKSEGTTRRDYRVQLALEILTGKPQEDGYMSREMQEGKEREPSARLAYEVETGNLLQEIGFAYWPDLPIGCSPDALVEDDDGFGLVSIKCPKAATHWEYLQAARHPPAYVPQSAHECLVVNDAQFVDFASFHPAFPKKLQLLRVRVYRSELEIPKHEDAVMRLLRDVDATVDLMQRKAA